MSKPAVILLSSERGGEIKSGRERDTTTATSESILYTPHRLLSQQNEKTNKNRAQFAVLYPIYIICSLCMIFRFERTRCCVGGPKIFLRNFVHVKY